MSLLDAVALVAGFLLVAYVPGAVLFRGPWGDRARRAALTAEERVFWAVVISAAMSSVTVLGLAAAGDYTLGRLLLINTGVSIAVVAAARGRLSFAGPAARPTWWSAVPAAIVLFSGWMLQPPFEYLIGGRDPGVYFNEGVRIARLGALVVEDPVVRDVPARARNLFFPQHRLRAYYGLRFMGSLVRDPSEGTVLSQFPQLFPASIAVGYGLAGLTGAREAPVFWGLLGVLALYVAGARLAGRWAAAAAALMLAVNIAQVWYARYPASEIMMQPLVLAGVVAFSRSQDDDDRFFAPLAGILLGLPIFFRVEAVLMLPCVGAAVGIGWLAGRKLPWTLLGSFAATSALGLVFLWRVTTSYFTYPRSVILRETTEHLGLTIGGLVLVTVLLYLLSRREVRRILLRLVPGLLLAIVLCGAAYTFWFRTAGGRLAAGDADAFRNFGRYYATLPALAAAMLGYTRAVRRHLLRETALLVTATIFGCFFFYKLRIVPEHFWLARRFIPIVLPATLLFAAAAACWPIDWAAPTRWRRVLRAAGVTAGVALIATIVTLEARTAGPVVRHVEYAGVTARLEALAGLFGDDELVVFESRNASDLHALALPLSYIYGRNVLVLASPVPHKNTLGVFLDAARRQYRNVYFLGGGGTDLMAPFIAARRIGGDRFQVAEYAQLRSRFPREVRYKEFSYGLYRFEDPIPGDRPFDLDIGAEDGMFVLRFHEPERSGATTFRWSRRSSFITVLGIRPERRQIVLWLSSGGRPARAAAARAIVELDDLPLGDALVTDGFRPYTFEVPEPLARKILEGDGSARLRIATPTWIPRDVIGGGDDRQLGVMVDRVEVK